MIIIHTKKGVLDIFPDTEITLAIENPFLATDKTPTPYSLDFELPATTNNLSIFGHPDHLSANIVQRFDAWVNIDSLSVMVGKLDFNGYNSETKIITTNFNGLMTDVDVDQSLHGADLGEYDLKGLNDNEIGDILLNAKDFVCCPVRNSSVNWINVKETPFVNTEPGGIVNEASRIKNYKSLYVNAYNPEIPTYQIPNFNDDDFSYISPIIYVDTIFQKLFGIKVLNAPVVILPTWKHWKENSINLSGPSYKKLRLSEALPDNVTIGNFINEISKLFGITFYFHLGKFKFKSNNDILNTTDVIDWNGKVSGEVTIEIQRSQGYTFGFAENNNGDRGEKCAYRHSIYQMINNSMGKESYNYIIDSTKELYKQEIDDKGVITYTCLASDYDESYNPYTKDTTDSEDSVDNITNLKQVKMGVYKYLHSTSKSYQLDSADYWYIPEIDYSPTNKEMFIGVYYGNQRANKLDKYHPYINNINVSITGEVLPGISLRNSDLAKHHKLMKEWVAKKRIVIKGQVLLSPVELRSLNITSKIAVNNKLFFIRNLTANISNNAQNVICDFEMIEF